jgi:two-component system phosphate regulon response regulator OmpR
VSLPGHWNPTFSILLVDDDVELATMLVALLAREGWSAHAVHSASAGQQALLQRGPGVVVLDMMLSDGNGLELCRRWRQTDPDLGILVLSARGDPFDRVLGLEMGADDYLPKPFEKRELVARLRALLRRRQGAGASQADLRFGALTVHLARREVSVHGQPVPLSSIEFKLLAQLVRHPGAPVSREQLSAAVRAGTYRPLDRTVDVQVARRRRRLAGALPGGDWIDTERGQGYAFVPRATPLAGGLPSGTPADAQGASL